MFQSKLILILIAKLMFSLLKSQMKQAVNIYSTSYCSTLWQRRLWYLIHYLNLQIWSALKYHVTLYLDLK